MKGLPAPEGYARFTDLRVRFAETDAAGVVYHSNFLVYCEVARIEYFRALTAGRRAKDAWEQHGFSVLIAHAECDYRAPAHFDEELRVWTRLAAVGRSSFTFTYRIVRGDGLLICEAKTVQVAIGKDTGRSVPLPEAWVAELRAFEPDFR